MDLERLLMTRRMRALRQRDGKGCAPATAEAQWTIRRLLGMAFAKSIMIYNLIVVHPMHAH